MFSQSKRNQYAPAVLCVTLLATTLTGSATETELEAMPLVKLEPYVVVATRTPLELDRISPSVEYIGADEIEYWQDSGLVDALSREAGVSLIQSGGQGSQTSLFIRGTESNHTSFFLDGRQLNRGFGNQFSLEFLSVGNLSSVQLQKGASSVNYGSSGIGGVIDSRSVSGLNLNGTEVTLSQEFGTYDYRNTALSVVSGDENYGLSISAGALRTDNKRPNDAFSRDLVSARFDYQLTEPLSFEWIGQYVEADKEIPGTTVAPSTDRDQKTATWLLSPGFKYKTDELQLHLFYSRSENRLDNYNAGAQNDIMVETDELHFQADYLAAESVLVSLGATYRNEAAFNSNVAFFGPPLAYEDDFEQLGAYVQTIWNVSEALELRGGLRYDDYSNYDNRNTGSIEALYAVKEFDLTLFAKVATSYAPPSAVDLAFDNDTSTPLNAEESLSYEFGFRHVVIPEKLQYSVTFFHNEIDELLSFEPSTFDTINIQEATTEGAEFEILYTLNAKVDVSFGYTYLRAVSNQLDDPRTFAFGDAASDVPLARRARHQVNFGVAYTPIDSVSLGLTAVGQFDREDINPATFLQEPAEDIFVMNAVADWAIDSHWSIFARIENLLDQEYAPARGFPALGRTGYLGVRASF